MNNRIKSEKILLTAFLICAIAIMAVFVLSFGVLRGEGRTVSAQSSATYVLTKNADGVNYNVSVLGGEEIGNSLSLSVAIKKINDTALANGEATANIQFGDGATALNLGEDKIAFSSGNYYLSGKLNTASKSQAFFVYIGASVTSSADIESNGYGFINNGFLCIEGGNITSTKETVVGTGFTTIKNAPKFKVLNSGTPIIRATLGTPIIDGGYTGDTIVSIYVDKLSVASPDPATFVIVQKTEGVPAPDRSKWHLTNQNFDLLASPYDDSKDNLISKKFYTISYVVMSNFPPIYLNGFQPIEKAYPGETIKLPTRCEISLTGDISLYCLHGWYESYDATQENETSQGFIGEPLEAIENIDRNWTVYAKFSDTPPNLPPCPKPIAPLEFFYDSVNGGYVVLGMDLVRASSFATHFKSNIDIVIPASKVDEVGISRPVIGIADNAFKASEYVGYSFTSLSFESASNIKSIGANAFKGASFGGSFVFPEKVESIGASAYESCGFGGDLLLPESVKIIGNRAFADNARLNGKLVLPSFLEKIGEESFVGSGVFMGKLTIPNTVKEIGARAFNANGNFDTIYLPNNANTVYGTDIFNKNRKIPIIAPNKTDYDIFSSNGHSLSGYEMLTYETNVTFEGSGGSLVAPTEKVQAKLFSQKLSFRKNADGVWTIDTSYKLPIVTRGGYTFKGFKAQGIDALITVDTVADNSAVYTASWEINLPSIAISTTSFSKDYDPSKVWVLQSRLFGTDSSFSYIYEWYKDGVNIDNINHSEYSISRVAQSGSYYVRVKGVHGDGTETSWVSSPAKSFIINRATFAMGGISFADKTAKEDGAKHSLELLGALPNGVSVSYDGTNGYNMDGVNSAGIYVVTATFSVADSENYVVPEAMTATLTINLAELSASTADGETNVTVSSEDGINPEITLKIKCLDGYSNKEFILGNMKYTTVKVFEVKMFRGGEEVFPNDTFRVKIAIDEAWNTFDNLNVLHIAPEGFAVEKFAEGSGGFLSFNSSATELSSFAVTYGEEIAVTPPENEPVEPPKPNTPNEPNETPNETPNDPEKNEEKGLKTSEIVAISVGCIAFVAIVGVLIMVFIKKRKK